MRRISAPSLFFMPALALLASCVHGVGAGGRAPDAAEADICAADNFKAFVVRFAEDEPFQERHTADPLRQVHIQNEGAEEPHPVEATVRHAQVKFPLFPSAAERKKYGLEVSSIMPDGRRMKVRVEKPDTDIVEVFFFEHKSCWSLVRYENLTL
jgi:hypothetical protein